MKLIAGTYFKRLVHFKVIIAIIIQFIHIVKLLYTYVQQINYTKGEVTLTEFSQTFFCAEIADVQQTSIGHSG